MNGLEKGYEIEQLILNPLNNVNLGQVLKVLGC